MYSKTVPSFYDIHLCVNYYVHISWKRDRKIIKNKIKVVENCLSSLKFCQVLRLYL